MPDPTAREPSPAPASRRARVKLLALVAGALPLAAIAFAALGGSANKIIDPVAQAATVSASAPGYRLHFSMQVVSSATSTPITASGDGTFDLHDHAGAMSLTMNLGNDPQVIQALGSDILRLQEIVDGTTIYVKIPAAFASSLPISGKQWIAVDLAKLTGIPGLSSLESNPVSSNPSEMLQYLRAASDSIVAEGQQRVDGYQTTHYRAELSLDRAANVVPGVGRAAAQQALTKLEELTHIHVIPVDVWVDAHHLVRRFEMNFAVSPAGAPAVNEEMTMDISHYGPQSRPALPPANEVANLDGLIGSGA